jgi:hypothetical protein
VRLHAEGTPDPKDRRLRHPQRLGHGSVSTSGGAPGRFLQRFHDHRFHQLVADLARGIGPLLVMQTLQPLQQEPASPLADGLPGQSQLLGYRSIRFALRAGQHDAGAQDKG